MFDAAIASAQPALCIPHHLPPAPRGRLIVIGAGKASAAMAQAVEQNWPGTLSGLVVTRHGYAVPCAQIEIAEAAHPVPDAAGMQAARRMLGLVGGLSADDLVLCLISGGGSALLPLPAERFDAGSEAGCQPRAAGIRRQHQRDELRAAPFVRHQGRTVGCGLPPGASADAADLRCAGRSPARHRFGPDGGRPDHFRGRIRVSYAAMPSNFPGRRSSCSRAAAANP